MNTQKKRTNNKLKKKDARINNKSIKNPKYRKSIIEAMDPEKVEIFGFERSYTIFERSINRISKEGDLAEELALQHLLDKNELSTNYRLNKVIALRRIKIEADIIDFDNKIIYETKSRKMDDIARKAIKEKWRLFEHDKKKSNYQGFQFKGIVVVNEPTGPRVSRIVSFEKNTYKKEIMDKKFEKYFETLKYLQNIKYNKTKAKMYFKEKKKGKNG